MTRTLLYILFIVISLFASCVNTDEGPVMLREAQLTRLITGDSSKVWQLMSRSLDGIPEELDECEMDDIIVLGASADSILIVFLQGTMACPDVTEDFIFTTNIDEAIPDTVVEFTQGDTILVITFDSTVIDLDFMDTTILTVTDTIMIEPMDTLSILQPITIIDRDTTFFVQFGSLNPISDNQIFQDTVNFRRFQQEGLTDSTEIIIEFLTSQMLNWVILSDSGMVREEYQFIEGL